MTPDCTVNTKRAFQRSRLRRLRTDYLCLPCLESRMDWRACSRQHAKMLGFRPEDRNARDYWGYRRASVPFSGKGCPSWLSSQGLQFLAQGWGAILCRFSFILDSINPRRTKTPSPVAQVPERLQNSTPAAGHAGHRAARGSHPQLGP